jgi:hypothetical protein
MPIKSGIGFGEAQVYNQPNAITGLYGKLLQQQAKDQAQFATDLNNVMSKYSTKGLREGDIKLTSEAYQQLKDKVTSSSARTPAERAQALAEARNGIQTIQEYADTALNAYKSLDQFAPDVAANPWKYQPGTKEVIEQLYKNPYAKWGDNYKELNPTTFHRQADESAIYKMFNNVNSDLAKIAPKFKATDVVDGKHLKTIYNVPEADAYSNLYTTMELTPEAKYTLTAKFQQDNPDKTNFTPADVAAYGLNLYKKLYGGNALQFAGGRTLIPTGGSGGKEAETVSNRGALLSKILNRVPGSDKELLNELNLPYGTKTMFLNGGKKGEIPMIRVVVPSKKNEPIPAAIANRPDLAAIWTSDKPTVVDIPLNQPDSERGLNELINRYSTGDVKYTKVNKGGTSKSSTFAVEEYLRKNGIN